jgi:tetratricopeptide (TPR) repeat protein
MSISKVLKTLTLTTVLVAATVAAQTPYDEGQKALREQNWTQAAEQFEQAIKDDKQNSEDSMYWRAHALYKAGRKSEAERQVRSLERKYPKSRWVKEAQLLQMEHNEGAPALTGSGNDALLDEELRVFALAQLMDRDPDRALPLVMETLENTTSDNIREDMLFVLGMSDDPKAHEAIARIARDSNNTDLQTQAIQMLGISSSETSIALLSTLYQDSDSLEVKQAVIRAYMIADDSGEMADTLGELLKNENNPELQTEIIRTLGMMDATDDLRALYPTLTTHETRVAALEAFHIAGDTKTLRQVLETETDPELRETAIRGIAMEGDAEAAALLESIYDSASSVEDKKAVLEALVMMDNAQDFALKVVRTETDIDLRIQAVHVLGVMEATDELAGLYANIKETELRKVVLESMMIADDTQGLIKVLESEKDPELRASAMQMLAISDDEESAQYLLKLYPDGTHDEKQAVIQSLMIMEDTEGLVSLLKTETDQDLKREILQMLTVMDSDASDEYLFELLENKG